jgi:HEAT repeat protein
MMRYQNLPLAVTLAIVIAFFSTVVVRAQKQTPIDGIDARANAAELAKQLSDADPNVRQRSAEALAQLAAAEREEQGGSARIGLGALSFWKIRATFPDCS